MGRINSMKRFFIVVPAVLCSSLFISCSIRHRASEYAKTEIVAAEKEFAQLCQKEGIEKAFTSYASDDAVILRGDSLLKGKEEIRRYYGKPSYKTVTLEWKPDFVDASASGEMGYTYGHYVFTAIDDKGERKEYTGIFHTVWKKKDGKWKFVWD
jgi:ketosteroid isomerase-like protein